MGMVFVVAARINRVASDSFGFEFFQFMQDGGQYGISLLQDFVVPEGDNGESQVLQVSCPCFVISGLFGVLPAVYFDNQFGVHADEIEDVLTQRLLAAEAVAAQSFAAQVFPQPLFGRRHVFAQVSAVVHEMRVIMREKFVVHFLVWVFVAARIIRCPHPGFPRGERNGGSWCCGCRIAVVAARCVCCPHPSSPTGEGTEQQ